MIYKISILIIFNFLSYFTILPFCQSEVNRHLLGNDIISILYFFISIFLMIYFFFISIKNKETNFLLILLSINFFVYGYLFKNLICYGCSLY